VRAELERRENDPEIDPKEVVRSVHSKIRRDIAIKPGYKVNMAVAVCRSMYGLSPLRRV